jgi:ribonuclease G
VKRIIIEKNGVTKTALTDGGTLVELLTDDPEAASVIGNIYAGIVLNVTRSGFVFIDIGLKRSAFLYLNDPRERGIKLKNGQHTAVQVLKDPAGDKGAYVTTRLSLAGRCAVAERARDRGTVSVSRKIRSDEAREALKKLAAGFPPGFSAVIRTDAETAAPEEITGEFLKLTRKLEEIEAAWRHALPPSLVYGVGSRAVKTFFELYRKEVEEIVSNDPGVLAEIGAALEGAPPPLPKLVLAETPPGGLFAEFGLSAQAGRLNNRKVWLNSGAFIVIDKTEACAVIDVNSGKCAGKNGHEQTALAVNIEAAREIARQVRLRGLSGIIIVDFIDMESPQSAETLVAELKARTAQDRVPVSVVGMTELGLMQMTRKKTRGG